MRTFAVGDIHGCRRTFDALLERCAFDFTRDRLWLVGDLVNRGPDSLGVLRRAFELSQELGPRHTVVLGNHDLHLLGLAAGVVKARHSDSLAEVLAAPDAPRLLEWLARQPLLLRDEEHVLVHAGLPPQWTVAEAEVEAEHAHRTLVSGLRGEVLRRPAAPAQGDGPGAFTVGVERSRRSIAALTRLRACDDKGRVVPWTGEPEQIPAPGRPWHAWRNANEGVTFVCGHWAAQGVVLLPHLIALDGGCSWGGPLAAMCLERKELVLQPNLDQPRRRNSSGKS